MPLSFFYVKSTGNEQVAVSGQARVIVPLRRQEQRRIWNNFRSSRLGGDPNVMAGQGNLRLDLGGLADSWSRREGDKGSFGPLTKSPRHQLTVLVTVTYRKTRHFVSH